MAKKLSQYDLEKELLELDAKIHKMPASYSHHSDAESSDYSYDDDYIDGGDDDDISISDTDEGSYIELQLPRTLDSDEIDVDQVVIIQAHCKGYLARKKYHQEIRMRKERINHINDLVSTEAVFVLSLQYLCTYYIAVLKEEALYKEDKIVQSMFATLEELREVDMNWLMSLQGLAANWDIYTSEIGSAADKLVDFLSIYNFYCSNYLHLITWIQSQEQRNTAFTKLEKKCSEELLKNTTIETNLQVLLSLPITNLRNYHVIFEKLLTCTGKDHVDYPKIRRCLSQLKDVANLAATSVKEFENKQKILAIEQLLIGELPFKSLVAPNRIFVFEGSLTKLCRKVAKRRYFWLLSDCLVYGRSLNMPGSPGHATGGAGVAGVAASSKELNNSGGMVKPQYKFRKMLPMLNSKFVNLPDDPSRHPNAFQIVTAHKSFIAFANSREQKNEWLVAHETALDIIASRGTAVKVKTDTNEMAPVWLHDNMATHCMICSKNFTVVTRRHHCRKCGRLVCGQCSSRKVMLSNLGKAKRVCEHCYRTILIGEKEAPSPRS